MITERAEKHQRKKRDAAYYREYRRRKKIGDSGNILQFPAVTTRKPPGTFSVADQTQLPKLSDANSGILHSKNIMDTLFVILLTGVMINLSAPFYMQGQSKAMAYLMASLVEFSILVLLSTQTQDKVSKVTKYFLIVTMSAYALVPIFLNPVKESQSKIAGEQNKLESQTIKINSIRSEISSRKQKASLLEERGRITLAQSELQTIATLEGELRNIATSMQPQENITLQSKSAYAIAIQRLLLMLCNLFLVHQLVASFRLQPEVQKKQRQYQLCCAT